MEAIRGVGVDECRGGSSEFPNSLLFAEGAGLEDVEVVACSRENAGNLLAPKIDGEADDRDTGFIAAASQGEIRCESGLNRSEIPGADRRDERDHVGHTRSTSKLRL